MRTFGSPGGAFLMESGELLGALPATALHPLVGIANREAMSRLVAGFHAVVQTACFETRLAAEDERVDFAFCVLPGFETTDLAARVRRRGGGWGRFADFLERWVSPGSDWSPRVPFVCVAFDLEGETPALPEPCLSVCLDEHFFARRLGFRLDRAAGAVDLAPLARDLHACLTGRELAAPCATLIERCAGADESVEVKHLSFMLPRRGVPVKLDLVLAAARVGRFLEAIGWPGAVPPLERALRSFVQWDGEIQLNLAVHPGLVGPLEVEVFSGPGDAAAEERLPFLERLVREGLASAAKARVLRDAWERPVSQDEQGRVLARSWYVKLRLVEGGARDAKAYLALMPRLLRPGRPLEFEAGR